MTDIDKLAREIAGRFCEPTELEVKIAVAAMKLQRERDAGIAKTGWLSADYDVVGIADADQCMKLCEHIAAAIRSAL